MHGDVSADHLQSGTLHPVLICLFDNVDVHFITHVDQYYNENN